MSPPTPHHPTDPNSMTGKLLNSLFTYTFMRMFAKCVIGETLLKSTYYLKVNHSIAQHQLKWNNTDWAQAQQGEFHKWKLRKANEITAFRCCLQGL